MSDVRLYFKLIGLSMRAQLCYRANLVMLLIGQFVQTIIEYLGVWALFRRFGAFGSWNLAEVSLFYGMAHMAFALSEMVGRGFVSFATLIRTGDFDRMLLRPRSLVMQILGSGFQLLRLGRFMQGLLVFLWAYAHLGVVWGAGDWCLFALSILGGALLFVGLYVLQAAMSFVTVDAPRVNIFTYGGVQAAQYPISEYKGIVKNFFLYVLPLCAVNYLPASALLRKGYLPGAVSYLSPLAGPLFFALTLAVWRLGMRKYQSTGS